MSADGIQGHAQRGGDGFVAEVFLVIEDEDGPLGLGKRKERGVHGGLELGVGEQLLGGAGVGAERVPGKVLEPLAGGVIVRSQRCGGDELTLAAAALPLILSDVDDDAIEVGGQGGVAPEVREGAVEAQEDLLREVFDVRAGAGHAREGAEDHGLVLTNQGLKLLRRCEIGAHGRQQERETSGSPKSFTRAHETFDSGASPRGAEDGEERPDERLRQFKEALWSSRRSLRSLIL